jgi:cell wall-associated NlpC family hydrolase
VTDRRTTPNPAWVDSSAPAQIGVTLTDLLDAPNGMRDRQLIYGDPITVLGARDGHSYVRSDKDGYIGFVQTTALANATRPTHRIITRTSHAYARADMKSPDHVTLSYGSRLTALSETPKFIETVAGFVPRQHLTPEGHWHEDPAAVAEIFLGTPYLWGGNSGTGIDCSGLVQAACLACNIDCGGDSDQQARTLGSALPEGTVPRRNDLFFWKGHVALVFDSETLIHANAHHMTTAFEPIKTALARIAKSDSPRTAHKRLKLHLAK